MEYSKSIPTTQKKERGKGKKWSGQTENKLNALLMYGNDRGS